MIAAVLIAATLKPLTHEDAIAIAGFISGAMIGFFYGYLFGSRNFYNR